MSAAFVANPSKAKIALLVLGSVVMTGAAGLMLVHPDGFPDYARILGILIPIDLIGWVGVVFFGLCLVMALKRMTQSGPVLEIDASGFRFRNWSGDLIPWSAVQRAEMTSINGQAFVSLWLRDPDAYRSSTLLGKLAGANKAMGFGDIALGAQGTDRSFDELAAAVHAHAPQLFA